MNTAVAQPMASNYRWVMAALSLAAHLVLGLNLFGISPVLPLVIEDYQINRVTAGLLISLPMLVGAALGIPGGMLVASIGVRRANLIAWIAMAILALSFLSPNFAAMLILRLAYGIGLAMTITSTGPLLMGWFSQKEVLVMNALNTALVSLGVAISVSGAAPLAAMTDWKIAMSLFGVLGVAGAVAWAVAGRDAPFSGSRPAPITLRQTLGVLRGRTVVLLVLTDAGVLVQYTALTSWLPSFFNEHRGMSLGEAGLVTGVLPFIGVFAVLLGGALPLRFGSARPIFLISGVAAALGGIGTFLLPGTTMIYVAAAVLGFGSWFYVPMLLTLPLRMSDISPQNLAVIYGSIMTFSGIAMFVSPILVGAFRDISSSFLLGFLVCWAMSWTALLAGALLPSEVTRSPTTTAAL
ncbi:MAG: MFS transporter [Dehalococcoidia bacterium]|nr:MFS transporter [Dehalococcoidia bacterium]